MDIKEIGEEMIKQDHRITQNVMFIVMDEVEVPAYHSEEAEHKERREETDKDLLCDSCLRLYERDMELPENCDECDEDAFVYWNTEERPILLAGVFFTAKACEEHIRENRYHYKNPRSYGISSWRNPEMIAVQQHLIELSGKKIPSHYL